MKIKKNPTILLLTALAMFANAADTPKSALTVAVYNFTGNAGAADYSATVTTLVTADLTTETNLVVVERAQLAAALSEQAFGASGMVNPEAAAKIGQITGAKVLVAGQVMKMGENHLVVVANIVGTETGRLFADKVEGAADNLLDLAFQLSRKIAQTISDQQTNLIASAQETSAQRLDRIIKGLGTNRPSVSVNIQYQSGNGHSVPSETEFGLNLLKAGFKVVDEKSDRKPDIEITGVETIFPGPRQGNLFTYGGDIVLKVQDRRTGALLAFEHEAAKGADSARGPAMRVTEANTVDVLAEKVLPLLAKQKYQPE
jgi:TolB-like protein